MPKRLGTAALDNSGGPEEGKIMLSCAMGKGKGESGIRTGPLMANGIPAEREAGKSYNV